MRRLFGRFKSRSYVWLALIATSLLLLAVSAYHARFRLNPDGVGYISIAQQWSDGHFNAAVNDLYPPVYSWLMVPFIKLGLNSQFAAMAVNFVAGVLTLAAGLYLVRRLTKNNYGATVLFWLVSLPFLIYAIGAYITPDLLVVLWLAGLLVTAVRIEASLQAGASLKRQLGYGAVLGVIGSLGYMTKQFLIPFFVAGLFLWFLTRWFVYHKQNRKFWRPSSWRPFFVPLVALIVMALTSAPWVTALSAKNHRFTISTAFSYNIANKFDPNNPGPASTAASGDIKRSGSALVAPHSPYAVSHSECPRCGVSQKLSVKLNGFEGLSYYLSQRLRAFPWYLWKISQIWLLTLPVLAGIFIAWQRRRINWRSHSPLIITGLFAAIYFGGYLAIAGTASKGGNSRYYWPLFFLAAVAAAAAWPYFRRLLSNAKSAWYRRLLVLLFVALPVASVISNWSAVSGLIRRAPMPPMRKAYETLRAEKVIPQNAKLASNNKRQALFLAYYLRGQSFGAIAADGASRPVFADTSVQLALERYAIDYYIDYRRPWDPPLDLGSTGARVLKVFNYSKMGCANYRGAKSEPCAVSVVKLQKAKSASYNKR